MRVGKETRLFWMIAEPIIRGTLKPGDRLPSYAMLAQSLGMSDQTVSRVMYALRVSGLIDSSQGEATFVSDDWQESWEVRMERTITALDTTSTGTWPSLAEIALVRPRTHRMQ